MTTELIAHFVKQGNYRCAIGLTIRSGQPLAPVLEKCGIIQDPTPKREDPQAKRNWTQGHEEMLADMKAELYRQRERRRRRRRR